MCLKPLLLFFLQTLLPISLADTPNLIAILSLSVWVKRRDSFRTTDSSSSTCVRAYVCTASIRPSQSGVRLRGVQRPQPTQGGERVERMPLAWGKEEAESHITTLVYSNVGSP